MALSSNSPSKIPQLFQNDWAKVSDVIAGCDEACLTLLKSLSEDYMLHHRINKPSDSGMKFVLYPSMARLSDVPESLHTDSGTLTLLFYKDWSIQAFLPDADMWAFISPPPEGCTLVNVANTLQRLSGDKLHSPRHRVTQPFDGAKDRYFLSYFLRPENELLEKWKSSE
jgi:isopenicillin N synthase-like dioxygenase